MVNEVNEARGGGASSCLSVVMNAGRCDADLDDYRDLASTDGGGNGPGADSTPGSAGTTGGRNDASVDDYYDLAAA